ncbi:unnamed protein product [Clonostachys rosea f. rosea IK726]|jgi:hypothetical protein|uniref:Uncharacterized protein n=1 Tax=Clonostachys rosea f. rosea IK726 TaxID=1349383 RepID=A0ACA9TX83_BIOOC|nr:unnamed protein product [Clonostachys rosea f. rosea IK726]
MMISPALNAINVRVTLRPIVDLKLGRLCLGTNGWSDLPNTIQIRGLYQSTAPESVKQNIDAVVRTMPLKDGVARAGAFTGNSNLLRRLRLLEEETETSTA